MTQPIILRSEVDRQRALSIVGKLPLARVWDVSISEHIDKRTNEQNKRLWLLHGLAADYTGYSADEMHEKALCRHFGYDEKELKDPLTGRVEIKQVPLKRSSARNKKEFSEFMESTEAWYVTEFGVFLP